MAVASSCATGATNRTPGWPGPPVRNNSVPRGACVLVAAATWSRSVPGTFPDLSSGPVRYAQVNVGRYGHGCAPTSPGPVGGAAGRAGGAPGRLAGGAAVQAAASRVSGITVAATRTARVACGAMRMLIPPAHRSGTGPFTLPGVARQAQPIGRPETGTNGRARCGGTRRAAVRRTQPRPGRGRASLAGLLGSSAIHGAVDHHHRAVRGIHAVQAHRAQVIAKEPSVPAPANHQQVGVAGLLDQHLDGVSVADLGVDFGAGRVRGHLADRVPDDGRLA